MQLTVIYDGALSVAQIARSNDFNYARFLIFDTPNLPDSEGIEIGFVLAIKIPVIGRTIAKDVELPLEVSKGILSSFGVVYIPTEYSDAGYSMYCAFNSAIAVDSFRVYAITEQECTIQKVYEAIQELLNQTPVASNAAINNAAFLTLGVGLPSINTNDAWIL